MAPEAELREATKASPLALRLAARWAFILLFGGERR